MRWRNLNDFLAWFRNDKIGDAYKVSDVDNGFIYWTNYLKDVFYDLITIKGCPYSLPSKEILHQIIETGHAVIVNHPKYNLITTYSTLYNYDLNGHFLNADLYNPYKGFYGGSFKAGNRTIGKDCEVIYAGDTECYVNNPGGSVNKIKNLIMRYARMLSDIESSIDIYIINTRRAYIFTAKNQQTKDAIISVFRGLEKGQADFVVEDNDILGDAKSLKNTDIINGFLTELLDGRDKILKQFLQQMGIYSTDDKAERLINAEVEQENRNVKPFIYSILKSINEGLERVNAMYGTEMVAELNYAIYNKEVEVDEI